MLLSEAIPRFLSHFEIIQGGSQRAIINYRHILEKFLKWKGNCDTGEITLKTMEEYRFYLHNLKNKKEESLYSIRSINHHLAVFRSIFRFLRDRDYRCPAPGLIEFAKVPDRKMEFLTREELQNFFRVIQGYDLRSVRDRAVIALFFSTGLRVSEMASLLRKQVEDALETRQFSVIGKGGKARPVFLSELAVQALKAYFEMRDDTYDGLFVTYKNICKYMTRRDRITLGPHVLQRMVKTYAKKAGIHKKVTPHTLRRSFGTELLMNGADIRSVQELLGHSSITTTQLYTNVANPHLKAIHERYNHIRPQEELS